MRFLTRAMNFAKAKFKGAVRSITSLPWIAGGDHPSRRRDDDALSLVPFYAAVRILSEQISSLPWKAYRVGRDGVRRPFKLPDLIRKPLPTLTFVAWVRQLVVSLCLRGNAYGYILEFDNRGQPKQVHWLNPDEVYVDEMNPLQPRYQWLGVEIPLDRIIHIALFVKPGKVAGLSPVSNFADSIGVGLKAADFGATWFDHGGHPPGTFKNTIKTITPEQSREISNRLENAMLKRKPLVFGSDWEFTALRVSPEEAQFIQTMKLNANHMAAIFGVPAERVGGEPGGSLTYDSPVQSGEDLHRFTIRPWLVLLEDAFSSRMASAVEFEINADALYRADISGRYTAHSAALTAGFMTVNEVREIEGLPPVEGGDKIREPQVPPNPGQSSPGDKPSDTDNDKEKTDDESGT